MSEQKLIAESRTFEQQMIERDKRATKAGFVVGGMGLLIAVLALVAVVVMLPLKQTDVELYTLDTRSQLINSIDILRARRATGLMTRDNYRTVNNITLGKYPEAK